MEALKKIVRPYSLLLFCSNVNIIFATYRQMFECGRWFKVLPSKEKRTENIAVMLVTDLVSNIRH